MKRGRVLVGDEYDVTAEQGPYRAEGFVTDKEGGWDWGGEGRGRSGRNAGFSMKMRVGRLRGTEQTG